MKAIGKALLCALAGALGWLVTAPMFPRSFADSPAWGRAEFFYILLTCGLIGGAAGLWQGLQRGSRSRTILDTILGFVFGALGGFLGYGVGGSLTGALFGPGVFEGGGFNPVQIVARCVVFAPLGMALGGAVGATLRSVRGAVSGAVGGALGGMLAGGTFDIIGTIVGPFIIGPQLATGAEMGATMEIGIVSRGISAAVLGLGIGLFTALVDRATRQAWLRLELGRNEGREWPIDSARTMIGRDERAHVPLFADPGVPPLAAVIERQGSTYLLVDPGSPIGIGLNGYRLAQPTMLNANDVIQIGTLNLKFEMKEGAARKAAEGRAKAQPIVPITGGTPVAPAPFVPQNPTMVQPATPTPQTGFVLVAQTGPMAGQRFPVSGPMEVGREADGLRISWDTQASRRHAMVAPAPGGVQVTDLNSTNGTLINGQRVTTALLTVGQTVQIGSTTFVLQAG